VLIIRNLFQHIQNFAFHGVVAPLKAMMPSPPALKELLKQSMFLLSYTGFEELPTNIQQKAERLALYPYGRSAVFNAMQAMKAAYWDYIKYIRNPEYGVKGQDLGWADPQRTYKEPNDFLYPSERQLLLRAMEFSAGASQYLYIGMGMPEIFRHKTFVPFTRLQSWWMNYFAKFLREAIHQAITGEVSFFGRQPPPTVPPEPTAVGGEPPESIPRHPKLPHRARLNLWKYIIWGGSVLTAAGYNRSYLLGVFPHWRSPPVQLAVGFYNYATARNENARSQALRQIHLSWQGLVPGALGWQEFKDVWDGKKPLSRLFFYTSELPPHYPDWNIPPLQAVKVIKESQTKLGTIQPLTDEELKAAKAEGREPIGEIYKMPDARRDITAAVGMWGLLAYPVGQLAGEGAQLGVIIRDANSWISRYERIPTDPSGLRLNFRKQDTGEAAVAEAYLLMFGKVQSLQCPNGDGYLSAGIIQQLMAEYNIPPAAIPNYDKVLEALAKRPSVVPQPTRPTPETPSFLDIFEQTK